MNGRKNHIRALFLELKERDAHRIPPFQRVRQNALLPKETARRSRFPGPLAVAAMFLLFLSLAVVQHFISPSLKTPREGDAHLLAPFANWEPPSRDLLEVKTLVLSSEAIWDQSTFLSMESTLSILHWQSATDSLLDWDQYELGTPLPETPGIDG